MFETLINLFSRRGFYLLLNLFPMSGIFSLSKYSRIAANYSVTSEAGLPKGSKLSVSKVYLLSGAPVNFKNNVSNKIPAATILSIQTERLILNTSSHNLFSNTMKLLNTPPSNFTIK